jgi:hypothetical protein
MHGEAVAGAPQTFTLKPVALTALTHAVAEARFAFTVYRPLI